MVCMDCRAVIEFTNERIEKLRSALFILIIQRSTLRNVWDQSLASLAKDPHRSFKLQPILFVPQPEGLDLQSLAYLLGVEGGQFLNELVVAQQKYRGVLRLIETRNALHEEFQRKLQAAGVKGGTVQGVTQIVGPVIMQTLQDPSQEGKRKPV